MEPFIIVYGVILAALILFLFGPWRYDIVALLALLFLTIVGIIPVKEAFSGFAHPAIWTVIGVLVISKGLVNSGLVNVISRKLDFVGEKPRNQIGILGSITGILSGFMNNIGALASVIPIAEKISKKTKTNISKILMPLAFASLLGGMITLIGTPPNIIIALYRAGVVGEPFKIFDFFPVGIGVAVAGIAFITLIGWKLVPEKRVLPESNSEVKNYKAEILIQKKSKAKGKTIGELLKDSGAEVKIDAMIHKGRLKNKPSKKTEIQAGDILIAKGCADEISTFVDVAKLTYAASKKLRFFSRDEILVEAVISSKSPLRNKNLETALSHKKYGVNILSVASHEGQKTEKISRTKLSEGDIIVFQGKDHNLNRAMSELNCQPIKGRGLRFGQSPRLIPSLLIFGLAILAASFRILPVEIAFLTAAVLMILTKLTSIQESYSKSIDWSIVVLLGAMIPVGLALEYTGGAEAIAEWGLGIIGGFSPWMILLFLMVVTMILSNTIDNVSTAVLMAPIGVGMANLMNASIDPFLMAVAVAASTPFLTPIGHQSVTLVMNRGGYTFRDFWKLGLPLSILILAVSIPLILHFWPL